MADQIVITEKTSQAKDIRDAVGHRYGTILPAEGHLFDLVEPEAVDPAWKRWSRSSGVWPCSTCCRRRIRRSSILASRLGWSGCWTRF